MPMVINHITTANLVTKTAVPAGDYVINPYVGCPHKCLYCYASFMKRFTNHAETWGDFLDVKHCAKKINVKRLAGKTVVLSTVTDPYNPAEKKFCATRGILEQFVDTDIHVDILTKGASFTRDCDIYKQIPHIRVGISLNTLDDTIRKDLEPRAAPIDKRIAALRAVHDAGITTYVFLSPLFPGISDFRAIISACRDAADIFYFENLNLRGAFRQPVLNYIRTKHPHLVPLYDEIYKQGIMDYWHTKEAEIAAYGEHEKIAWHSWFYHEKIRKR